MIDSQVGLPAVKGAAARAVEALAGYAVLGPDVVSYVSELAQKDAESSIRCIQVFLDTYRLKSVVPEHLVPYYRDLWLTGEFIPVAKWATAWFLADMAGRGGDLDGKEFRDLPPTPACCEGLGPFQALFPDSPSLVRVLRSRLRETTADKERRLPTRRAMTLAWSFLGLKAMFPPMWVAGVAKSLEDHASLLSSTPPPLTEAVTNAIMAVGESISRLACDTSRPNTTITSYSQLPKPRLSSSAGWVKLFDQDTQRWTTMRGTRAAQFQRLQGLAGGSSQELFSMAYTPHAGVVEFRQHPYSFRWDDWDFDPKVSVVALQEPFKIRTISIADGPATAAASPLQKTWHGVLKGLNPFRLVGGERVASSVLGWRRPDGSAVFRFDGTPFVSGDYSAATDRLSMLATKMMLGQLLKRIALPTELRSRLETSLCSSLLDYSRTLESFRGKVPDALLDSIALPPATQQTNGQLMGNVLSFPLLCLINLSGWIAAMSTSTTEIGDLVRRGLDRGYFNRDELNALPVIINGDDILFQASPEDYKVWLSVISSLGFKPSVGKNYYSPLFFTVNSELYTKDGFVSRPWWGGFETDAVRLRNELRFETGMDVLSADMRKVLPKMQEFLRQTCDEHSWPIVNPLWIKHHHAVGLLEPYKGLNWFLATELGGMGLDDTGCEKGILTYGQKKLAIRMSLDPDKAKKFFPGAETSLVTEESRGKIQNLLPSMSVPGEIVFHDGMPYVVDNKEPLRVRSDVGGRIRLFMRVHPTVDTYVQRSRHVDAWLDYHVQGIRFDRARVEKGVRDALHWGLRISDKHLTRFGDLETKPRYRCMKHTVLIPVSKLSVSR